MRASLLPLAALLTAAASLTTLSAAPATAQVTTVRDRSGELTRDKLRRDRFTTLFSFRISDFAPGSSGPGILGGVGDCLPGDPCQTSTGAAASGSLEQSAGATYRMAATLFSRFAFGPHVGILNPTTPEKHLELPLASLPAGRINGFYIAFRGVDGGALRISDPLVSLVPLDLNDPSPEFPLAFDRTVSGAGDARYAGFRMREGLGTDFGFDFTATTSGLTNGGPSPVIDVYFGTTTTPEPATVGLLGAGLAAIGGLAWRRRRLASA